MIDRIAGDGIPICRERNRREDRENVATGEVFQERSFGMDGRMGITWVG